MNNRMKVKYLLAFCNSFLKIDLKRDYENYVNFKYTSSFQRKMLPNLTSVLIYSLTKCVLEDVLKTAVLKTLHYSQKNIHDRVYFKVS